MAKALTAEDLSEALGFPTTLVVEKKEEETPKEEPKKEEAKTEEEEKKEEKKEVEPAKEKEAETKTEEEKKEEGNEKEESTEEKKEEKPADINAMLAKELEGYEIKDVDELKEVLGGIDQLLERLDIAEKKGNEPVFKSEAQKKAFEFITSSGYDPSKYGEGLITYATLLGLDIDKADAKSALEQRFIIENPELTRQEAISKFNKDFKKKYEINKENFEDPEALKEEEESVRIDLKSEEAKAKKFLKQKQEEFKVDTKEEAKPNKEEVPAVVQTGIERTVGEFKSYVDGFNEITFTEDKNEDNKFTYKIPDKYLKQIQAAGEKYLSKPGIYNEKGIVPNHDPEDYVVNLTMALAGKDIIQAALKHTDRKAAILKAEKIAEVKPDKKGGVADGKVESMDHMQQAEIEAEKRAKARR